MTRADDTLSTTPLVSGGSVDVVTTPMPTS